MSLSVQCCTRSLPFFFRTRPLGQENSFPGPARSGQTNTHLSCLSTYRSCLRQLLGIRWYDRVRNDEVLQRTGLTSLSHLLSRRLTSGFGHVARLDDVTPANMALQLHINISLNRPPDRTWRRPPGRPRNKWLDELRNDSTRLTGDLWRRAVDRGHGGATTRRPSPATRT